MKKYSDEDFIKLMNEEHQLNGRSEIFVKAESEILKTNNPDWIFECAENVKGIDVSKFSEKLIKFNFEDYKDSGINYFVPHRFKRVNTTMLKHEDANAKGHLKCLLKLEKHLNEDEQETLLLECLLIANKKCPELVVEIIGKLLKFDKLCLPVYHACYMSMVGKNIPSAYFIKLNKMFLEELKNAETYMIDVADINDIVKTGFVNKKEVYKTIINNQNLNADIRMDYFNKLTLFVKGGHTYICDDDHTDLAEQLIEEFNWSGSHAWPINHLKKYISEYRKLYRKETVSSKLESFISKMIEDKTINKVENINPETTTEQGKTI